MMGIYTQASTANPTGRRPWNSRLSYYTPNVFAVPTTGQGPFLLQPGITGRPMANGGLGCDGCNRMGLAGVKFPNFANFQRNRQSRREFDSAAPLPIYTRPPVSAMTNTLSGLGQTEILGLEIDPTMLALGAIALLAAFYLIGSGRPRRKAHRLRKKISRAQGQLREVEAL